MQNTFLEPIVGDPMVSTTEAFRLKEIHRLASELIRLAESYGVVLAVEQRSLHPLAMGHYQTIIDVRPVRK